MKIEANIYVQAVKYEHNKDFKIQAAPFKFTSDEFKTVVDICERVISVDVPDFTENQFNEAHIKQLKKLRIKTIADNHLVLTGIDEKIQSLLAIENKG